MIKEFMLSTNEIIKRFPMNSVHEIDGKNYVVKGHQEAINTTCFASYPSVIFKEVKNRKILEIYKKIYELEDFKIEFCISLPVKKELLNTRSYKFPYDIYSCYLNHNNLFICKENVTHFYISDEAIKVIDKLNDLDEVYVDLSKIDISMYDVKDKNLKVTLSISDIGYSDKIILITLDIQAYIYYNGRYKRRYYMPRVLALRNDGKITYCCSPPEKRRTGRCNHIAHINENESRVDFIKRTQEIEITDRRSGKMGSVKIAMETKYSKKAESKDFKNIVKGYCFYARASLMLRSWLQQNDTDQIIFVRSAIEVPDPDQIRELKAQFAEQNKMYEAEYNKFKEEHPEMFESREIMATFKLDEETQADVDAWYKDFTESEPTLKEGFDLWGKCKKISDSAKSKISEFKEGKTTRLYVKEEYKEDLSAKQAELKDLYSYMNDADIEKLADRRIPDTKYTKRRKIVFT